MSRSSSASQGNLPARAQVQSRSIPETIAAIRSMEIRGAAAIGLAGAHALAAALQGAKETDGSLMPIARRLAKQLDLARPTAVTLHNALGQVLVEVQKAGTIQAQKKAAQESADALTQAVVDSHRLIAQHGAKALAKASVVLTHCHSTTVIEILRLIHRGSQAIEVIATETRPFRQGLRTTQQLHEAGIPCALIVDSAVSHVLATREVNAVLVGADAVASDGSLFNKIGTSGVAALAKLHEIPVYCAAGVHKFTPRRPDEIPIEERPRDEIADATDIDAGIQVFNPVFDRTEPDLIASYITEHGLRSAHQAVEQNLPLLPPEEVWK